MEQREELTVLLNACTLSSAVVCALSTPLDVARHSAQAAMAARKATPGLRESLSAAAQPRRLGLFRGLVPALSHAALSPSIFLFVYEVNKSEREAVEAGMIARAVQTSALQPLEFLRTIRQGGALLSPGPRQHLERGLWDIICSDGVKSLWRGGIATLARDVGASGVFWTSFITLRGVPGSESDTVSPVQSAGFAAAAAAVAAAVTQPLDVIKTRMQVNQMVTSGQDGYRKVRISRFFTTLSATYGAAGIAGFWTGGLARIGCSAAGGMFLGPLFEFGQLLAEDAARPVRKAFYLPPDTTNTIVHPRSQRAMFIEVK